MHATSQNQAVDVQCNIPGADWEEIFGQATRVEVQADFRSAFVHAGGPVVLECRTLPNSRPDLYTYVQSATLLLTEVGSVS